MSCSPISRRRRTRLARGRNRSQKFFGGQRMLRGASNVPNALRQTWMLLSDARPVSNRHARFPSNIADQTSQDVERSCLFFLAYWLRRSSGCFPLSGSVTLPWCMNCSSARRLTPAKAAALIPSDRREQQ